MSDSYQVAARGKLTLQHRSAHKSDFQNFTLDGLPWGEIQVGKRTAFPLQISIEFSSTAHKTSAQKLIMNADVVN